MPKEETLRQLRETIENPRYEVWNGTSLSHLFINATGIDGSECRILSLRLLDGYISFMERNADVAVNDDEMTKEEVIRIMRTEVEKISNWTPEQMHNAQEALRAASADSDNSEH